MNRLTLLLLLLCPSFAFTQFSPPDYPDQSNPYPPPDLSRSLSSQLTAIIASGVNYYTYLPKLAEYDGDVAIANQGALAATILLVVEDAGKRHQTRLLEMQPFETVYLPGDHFLGAEASYILSLQPFAAKLDEPVDIAGKAIQLFRVQEPRFKLKLTTVEMPDGQVRTMGIDRENRVYFPIYTPGAPPFGHWSEDQGGVQREDLLMPLESNGP